MSNFTIEHVRESVMNLIGKNLFFDKETMHLMWCDVHGGMILRLNLNTNQMNVCRIVGERMINFCVPIKGNSTQYLVGAGRRLLLVTWDGMSTIGTITKVLGEVNVTGVRINEINVDRQGHLLFGTMMLDDQGDVMNHQKRICGLYRFTMKDGIVLLKDNVGLGNGITWNNQFTKMYFIDSFDCNICEYDYDCKTGMLHNQTMFMDLKTHVDGKKTFLTGMTMDTMDNMFVSIFGSGKILKINTKNQKIEHEMKFSNSNLNVTQLTGLHFGGKSMDQMFVTTAGLGLHGQMQQYPSGFLFKVSNLGTKGTESCKFDMTA